MQSKQKKMVSTICMVMALSLVIGAPGKAMAVSRADIDALKSKQSAIQEQQTGIKTKISDLQEQQESAMEQKTALDEQNELARQEIELINEQIDLYNKLIEEKSNELEQAKADEAKQKEALRVRMRAMEETGSLTYFSILFESNSFSDLLARLDFISSIMKYDKDLEEAYIAAREHVEEVKAEYEAVLAEHEVTKVELEQKKAELELQIQAAETLIISLEEDIEQYKKVFEDNEAAEATLSVQINEMVAALERQQREAAEAAKNNGTIIPNFVTGTGSLKWPLPGIYPKDNTYGMRFHPILKEMRFHAGTDIGANSGTPILAADSGTVAVATYGGGYGNYVVISHGSGISTLYAHMSSMAVSAGSTVSKGDVIGYVGSTGLSTGAHLHFEVRVGGQTTDPMGYSYS
ncbi:MAG: murein hydrolase activator EnvC family protein [Oscillospiraceae bacterium]|jgi:murein DD-endopeptidase MepM/ murein hydrolase activator NlpD